MLRGGLIEHKSSINSHINQWLLGPTGVVTSVVAYSLTMTTTSHEMCRISLKEFLMNIFQGEITYITPLHCKINAVTV